MFIVTNRASSVFAGIEAIAGTSSKLDKEQMINTAGTSSPLFMRVIKAAYDPFTTYGITNPPDKTPGVAAGTNTLDEIWPWDVLGNLSNRTLSGSNARLKVQQTIDLLDAPSAALFARIIRKDLRAGFSEGTINRVFPKTLAEFPYMRCSLPDKSDMPKWDWDAGIIVQEKADGMFTNVNVDGARQVLLTTRQGSPIPTDKLPGLESAITSTLATSTQSHGELTVLHNGEVLPREIGNGMLNSVLQGGELDEDCTVRLEMWDQIPLASVVSKGKCTTPYKNRLADLMRQIKLAYEIAPDTVFQQLRLIPTRVVKKKADALTYYRELLKHGKEGVVCKHPLAIWRDSTSKDQVKLKLEVDIDLEVVNVLPGTPGTKTAGRAGSLECRSHCSALSVNVAVKNEKMRALIDAAPDEWIGKIMVVRSNAITAPSESNEMYSLFHPRFVEDFARPDKAVADDLEQVQSIFLNAVEGEGVPA
jgi:DNA ligase-1